MTAAFRTFWGTLLSVLLKCLAGLGIAPAARATARRRVAATTTPVAAPAAVRVSAAEAPTARGEVAAPPERSHAGTPVLPAQKAAAPAAARRARAPLAESGQGSAPTAPSVPGARRRTDVRVPAPRTRASRTFRRMAGRTLPPTMKQRIRAEAHGATPSARSVPLGLDAADLAGLNALAATATAGAATDATAGATSGSGHTRAELALCA
jgi:hypothetical protein